MRNRYVIKIILLALSVFISINVSFLTCTEATDPDKVLCEHKWATPIEKTGLPNFHKVTEELYRGAQPSAFGMQELKKMGIKTVVNLRSFHSDRDEIGDTGLAYEHIYMKAWHPEEKEIVRFLQIVTDKNRTPVFVHCQHGADRTGTMCAIYRIAVCGWSKEEAIKEMTEGDFGFHEVWTNLIEFIENLDINEIKRKAGITKMDTSINNADIADKMFWERTKNNCQAILVSRRGLAEVINFMENNSDIFPIVKLENERFLNRQQRLTIWRTWQVFLDHILALDSLGQLCEDIYQQTDGEQKKAAFRVAFATFLAQYRYALDFIDITERDSSMHTILNEPVPELGIPKDTYSRFKFRFLNVLRGAEFARLDIIYRFYGADHASMLTKELEEDKAVIWRAGKGRGPLETARNAIRIIHDTAFTGWFPIQKGVSEWMGDTKVWRLKKNLISEEQIKNMLPKLEPGDVLLIRREWYLSNIGLPGFWPHGALYIGSAKERDSYFDDPTVKKWVKDQGQNEDTLNDLLQARYPEAYKISNSPQEENHLPRIIEAIGEGVCFTTLEHSADADSLVVLRPRLSKTAKAQAILRAFHFGGRPYDFNFDFLTDAKLVCTELIYKSYESTDSIKGLQLPLIEMLGRKVVPANDIACLFDTEYGNKNQQFDFVIFLDGYERQGTAVESDVAAFRKSWKRPKWHILIQDELGATKNEP